MIDLPKGEPTEQEIRELTEMFPKFYPALRKKLEESRPKTHEDSNGMMTSSRTCRR